MAHYLPHLVRDEVSGSPAIRGGQSAANRALASFDVVGYAGARNEVYPPHQRGASRLSPYIRHGLLSLPEVWAHVADGPAKDTAKFRDELLWQEFARHWYARLGTTTRTGTRNQLITSTDHGSWDQGLACIDSNLEELARDGWLVNQTRMWLASHWAIRQGLDWRAGEDHFFAHLLDGSRAANRLGWQWTTGTGSSKHYGFSRQQVQRRAPGLCSTCQHNESCPIETWPDPPSLTPIDTPSAARTTADATTMYGPQVTKTARVPKVVWLTAESLGSQDPALIQNPDLPVIFVFDEPLLRKLQLSSKRLVFLTETLAELGQQRDLTIALGNPTEQLAGQNLAVTFAPIPGFRRLASQLQPGELHPWLWLVEPSTASVSSFSAWRKCSNPTAWD